jgi:hypothetical protein
MATDLLNKRLELITRARMLDSMVSDPTPTLADVEKTHIIFTNAHFKPFAALGYEYNKVKASAGSPALGQEVTFSIPQFGDFFHDMVVHVKLRQPVLTSTATNASDAPAMRWCNYIGERLLKKVQFEVNGNPLDEYTSSAYNFYREFQVGPHKKVGWDRCVGQEIPHEGYVDQPTWANSGVTPAAGDHRFLSQVVNGHQTPSGQKDTTTAGDVEMFIPLLLWCNKDSRLSVPSVAIPYGQRFINLTLADQTELVNIVPRGSGTYAAPNGSIDESTNLVRTIELYINNIFVNPEIHNIFIKRIGFNLVRIHRQQTHTTSSSTEEVLLQQLKWPIESLFVGMKLKDYNSSTASTRAEHLDKWHTFSQVTNTTFAESGWQQGRSGVLVDTVADSTITVTNATETAVVVTQGTGTLDYTTVLQVGDLVTVTTAGASLTSRVQAVAAGAFTLEITEDQAFEITNTLAAVVVTAVSFTRPAARTSTVAVCTPTLDSVTIKAHGIPIYNDFPSAFYNAYLPFHFGGANIVTPKDCGALMVTFCLYPGTYQPSGHVNVSRAREFYIEYTSSVISPAAEGTLIVLASALNFLLISDGSAVLRYST